MVSNLFDFVYWNDVCLHLKMHCGKLSDVIMIIGCVGFLLSSRLDLRWMIGDNFRVSDLGICPFGIDWFIIYVFWSYLLY